MSGLNRDELTKLIYDNELFHGMVNIGIVMDMTHIEKFAQLVAAAEREACAKVCEEYYEYYGHERIAHEIRLRGQG
jgi:hypothetical protein